MADDEESLLNDSDSSVAPSKKRGIGGLITGFLKWIIIAIAAIIVIVVISLVTVLIVNKNSTKQVQVVSATEEYTGKKEIYDWYKSIGVIQTTTSDDIPATVRVNVFLGYKQDDKTAATEINQRSVELRDYLRQYFRSKSSVDLRNPNNEDRLKMEIRNGINDKVLSNSKIREISFDQLDVIEQN
ncbi:MAG: flagellar basal body-associated FliL family protein [Treponema sp.]|nr:flagellar basal body-associated FliL family protein [Treponema sp.]